MKEPGRGDDGVDVGVTRLESKLALRRSRIGDQEGHISGPTWSDEIRNARTDGAFARSDDFEH
jgi:hypothetical protein